MNEEIFYGPKDLITLPFSNENISKLLESGDVTQQDNNGLTTYLFGNNATLLSLPETNENGLLKKVVRLVTEAGKEAYFDVTGINDANWKGRKMLYQYHQPSELPITIKETPRYSVQTLVNQAKLDKANLEDFRNRFPEVELYLSNNHQVDGFYVTENVMKPYIDEYNRLLQAYERSKAYNPDENPEAGRAANLAVLSKIGLEAPAIAMNTVGSVAYPLVGMGSDILAHVASTVPGSIEIPGFSQILAQMGIGDWMGLTGKAKTFTNLSPYAIGMAKTIFSNPTQTIPLIAGATAIEEGINESNIVGDWTPTLAALTALAIPIKVKINGKPTNLIERSKDIFGEGVTVADESGREIYFTNKELADLNAGNSINKEGLIIESTSEPKKLNNYKSGRVARQERRKPYNSTKNIELEKSSAEVPAEVITPEEPTAEVVNKRIPNNTERKRRAKQTVAKLNKPNINNAQDNTGTVAQEAEPLPKESLFTSVEGKTPSDTATPEPAPEHTETVELKEPTGSSSKGPTEKSTPKDPTEEKPLQERFRHIKNLFRRNKNSKNTKDLSDKKRAKQTVKKWAKRVGIPLAVVGGVGGVGDLLLYSGLYRGNVSRWFGLTSAESEYENKKREEEYLKRLKDLKEGKLPKDLDTTKVNTPVDTITVELPTKLSQEVQETPEENNSSYLSRARQSTLDERDIAKADSIHHNWVVEDSSIGGGTKVYDIAGNEYILLPNGNVLTRNGELYKFSYVIQNGRNTGRISLRRRVL